MLKRIRHRDSRSAFTLLELLVVVAISLLLMAVLLPSLMQARKQAWRIACAGNLRLFGRALDYYKSEHGRYPTPPPGRITALDGIGSSIVKDLVKGPLGDPRVFYCPVSLATDKYARGPFDPGGLVDRKVRYQWETGEISYAYLAGVTYSYPDSSAGGRPTYNCQWESPDSKLRSRNVLAGDRTVVLNPKYRTLPGSNHGRQGGWFYFTAGDVGWWTWPRLTRHPTPWEDWYWPATP